MRKLVLAISALALAVSAAFADPIADRKALMKENGKAVGGLAKMAKGETPFDAAAVLAALTGAQRQCAEDRCRRAVPGRQRQGRHHGLAENLGGHGRLQGPRSTSSRPTPPRQSRPPAQDRRGAEAAARHDRRQIAAAATRPTASRRADPWPMGLLRKLAVAGARPRGGRRGGVLVPDDAAHASSAAKSPRSGAGDAARGERIFHAGGCTSCHARPKSKGAAQLELAGGLELKTPFGTFVPPNISPDPEGRHRRMVARRFRQRHAARRFAGRPALSIRPFPTPPMRA